jgi:hypothetical protein
MGVSWHHANWLVECQRRGVNFARTLTLGRLQFFLTAQRLAQILEYYELQANGLSPLPQYAEPFFRAVGAETVTALDYSDYQKASLTHDLNVPVPDELCEQFDVVDDGGTLEHVFNFPVALQNAMRMVRVGGSLILATPASAVGHGFYSLSPELYFRALSSDNGFRIERMCAHYGMPESDWFEVADPAQLGRRVEITAAPSTVYLLIWAVRERLAPIFARWPQQSDYQSRWQTPPANDAPSVAPRSSARRSLLRRAWSRAARTVNRISRTSAQPKALAGKQLENQPECFRPQQMWWTTPKRP